VELAYWITVDTRRPYRGVGEYEPATEMLGIFGVVESRALRGKDISC
jgi:hypothetical protein